MKLILSKSPKIKGKIRVSGDKSITHRGLIIGSIAEGKTILRNYSTCEDCYSTLEIMKELGVQIKEDNKVLEIEGKGLTGLAEPSNILDCRNSGTSMRLIAGLLAGQDFFSILTGDKSLLSRPMKRIVEPLRRMGAIIYGRNNDEYAPLAIKGTKLKGIDYKLPIPSAQVKSSLLIASLYARGNTIIEEPTQSRDHTERMLNLFGAKVEFKGNKIILKEKNKLNAQEVFIPGDISSAAFFIVLASCQEDSELLIEQVGINPTRTGIIEILKKMGAQISILNKKEICNEPVADILIKGSSLKGIEIGGDIIPKLIDELPILALAGTQAKGKTIVRDAKELRVKESDRIHTITEGLRKLGAKIEEKEDGFIVEGPVKLKGNICESFGDHRIGMTLAIGGLLAEGETTILEAECINVSFPEFIRTLRRISGKNNIVEKN
ncbi:MAG: 3-phosphoshikimate 1-carboxyvinyltransferase [candidate division WOR-3 bacterium]